MTTKKTAKAVKKLNTNLHNIFATQKPLEEDGAWVDVNELLGLRIKVRRINSDYVVKAYERILREEFSDGRMRKPSDFDPVVMERVIVRQYAEAVLVSWENLCDLDTGEEIPYSLETAKELLEMKDFREFVAQAAEERATFREQADKDSEGNSSNS